MLKKCDRCGNLISTIFPVHWCLAVGDAIYYHTKAKDTFPGIVLKIKWNKVKIKYNALKQDVISWVSVKNISIQQ